jgi:hypothetical protein
MIAGTENDASVPVKFELLRFSDSGVTPVFQTALGLAYFEFAAA